jgi:N-acetylglucosaminyldiphosphoundecaprenol N-acetyl-beta-D-mannosaminyltransferase
MKEQLLMYFVDTSTTNDLTDVILLSIKANSQGARHCSWLSCINPHSYVVSLDNLVFSQALSAADWLVPDGAGIVWASRLLGGRIRERVTGSDLFHSLNTRMNAVNGFSVFFLGATEETLSLIQKRFAFDYPNVHVSGLYSPPFKNHFSVAENASMLEAINTASPDVLWVGMSSPKQDIWLYENHDKLNVGFAAAIGAVFDFYTGKAKRAPRFFQQIGLEWFVRSIQEPRRLWRRHYVNAPIFVWHVIRDFVMRKN